MSDTREDKRNDLIAQHRRAAARELRDGNPAMSILWGNEAWRAEHGEWLEYIRREDSHAS